MAPGMASGSGLNAGAARRGDAWHQPVDDTSAWLSSDPGERPTVGRSPLASCPCVMPQDAVLLGGELLLSENSLLPERRQLPELGNRIGRDRRLVGRCLLPSGLLAARQPNDHRGTCHGPDQT